jgi:exopolysaccharide production protein ExoZ
MRSSQNTGRSMRRNNAAVNHPQPSETIFGFQILRGIAASMVVAFHIGWMLSVQMGTNAKELISAGATGVDIFFVLSGFIMLHTTRFQFSPQEFLARRVIRVAPIYWLVTVAHEALALSLPRHVFKYRFDLTNFLCALFFIPCYNFEGVVNPPVAQGWTLTYEMFFYVLLAFVSTFFFKIRTAVLSILFPGLVLCGFIWHSTNAVWTTYTDPLLIEFLVGCIIAMLVDSNVIRLGKSAACLIIIGGFILLIACWELNTPPHYRGLLLGLPAGCVVLGTAGAERFFNLRKLRILNAIGDSSYSLYLTHTFVISAMSLVFRSKLARAGHGIPVAFITFAICVGLGIIFYRLVERPMTRYLNRRFIGPRRINPRNAVLPPPTY